MTILKNGQILKKSMNSNFQELKTKLKSFYKMDYECLIIAEVNAICLKLLAFQVVEKTSIQ